MLPLYIGIGSGLISILLILLLKDINKKIIYGLVLAGIGFLYVGFSWSDFNSLLITSAQAVIFLFLAYYGITKHIYILAAGYFLHGCWDLIYNYYSQSDLVPKHYDLFCMAIDWTMGIYIWALGRGFPGKFQKSKS